MDTIDDLGRKPYPKSVFRRKILSTALLYFASFMWGWMIAIKGPSLMDLQQIIETGTTGGATLLTSASIGGVVGAVIGGFLYDRLNVHMSLSIAVMLYSATCALIPYCSKFWIMATMFFFHEFVMGPFKTGGNVEVLHLWNSRQRKTALQGFHLSFSLGTTLSPFILEPFLSRKSSSGNVTEEFMKISVANRLETSSMFLSSLNTSEAIGITNISAIAKPMAAANASHAEVWDSDFLETNIHYAYIISGVLGLVSGAGLLVRHFLDESRNPVEKGKECLDKTAVPRWVAAVTLFLFLLLYFFLDEVEDTTPALLSSFLYLGLGWSKIIGVRVTSTFYGAFTAGRFLGTLTINFLSHVKFFIVCSCTLVFALVGLLLSVKFSFEVGVWLSVALLGISLSVVMPATLTWMEEEFLSVSGKIVSVVFVGLSLGGIANPQLIGYCMQHVTYMSYSYILLAESFLFVLTLAALKVFQKRCIRRYMTFNAVEQDTTKEMVISSDAVSI